MENLKLKTFDLSKEELQAKLDRVCEALEKQEGTIFNVCLTNDKKIIILSGWFFDLLQDSYEELNKIRKHPLIIQLRKENSELRRLNDQLLSKRMDELIDKISGNRKDGWVDTVDI